MGDRMEFPKTFEEFAKMYGFKDKEEVYTNGSDLIQIFRVKQWQEHIFDKIRAEIEQLTIAEGGNDYVRKMAELFSLKIAVLQILNKYSEESEDK